MRSVNGKCLSPVLVKQAHNIAYDADRAAFSHYFFNFLSMLRGMHLKLLVGFSL